MEGYGPTQIARMLAEKQVLIPVAAYYCRTGIVKHKSAIEDPTLWVTDTVNRILQNREYTGDTVLGRTRRRSYKDKRKMDVPKEEWNSYGNTHEPIIDRDTWETVQKLREPTKCRNCSTGEKDKFAGLVVCADCGKKMYNCRAKTLTHTQESFVCGNYRRKTKSCTSHFIRTVVLEELVLTSVREVLSLANTNESMFREYAMLCGEREQQEALKEQRREMDMAQRRIAELYILVQKLFEGNATGRISDERFDVLSRGYESEQRKLTERLAALQNEIRVAEEKKNGTDRFLKIARKYEDLQELTPTILRELIEKILIYEPHSCEWQKAHTKDPDILQLHRQDTTPTGRTENSRERLTLCCFSPRSVVL